MNAGQLGATNILAAALAGLDFRHDESVAGDDFVALEHGVQATIILPTGDQYRVSVEWLGDHEGAPA